MAAPRVVGTSTNILSLDGGGVRGLSALIVLRKLLCMVNAEVHPGHNAAACDQPMKPLEVFDFVVGTSTGGLIALMIVKLGMDVDQCIDAYKSLSKKIFRHRHRRTYFTQGLGRKPQYSSKILRDSILEDVLGHNYNDRTQSAEEYRMKHNETHGNHHCSVVCRELDSETDQWKRYSVFLCSHDCSHNQKDYGNVKVIDAALATSAAPTYFDKQWIADSLLVDHLLADGGFGQTNNPSFAIWEHHWSFQFDSNKDQIHFINIGTGAAEDQLHESSNQGNQVATRRSRYQNRQRKWIQFIKRPVSMLKNLQAIATDALTPANQMETVMRTCARGDVKPLQFHRLSVDNGKLHAINLAAYNELDEIERLTDDYFKVDVDGTESEGYQKLREVATQLAGVYRARHSQTVDQSVPEASLHLSTSLDQTANQTSGHLVIPLDQHVDQSPVRLSPLTPINQTDSLRVPTAFQGILGSSANISTLSDDRNRSTNLSRATSISSLMSAVPSLADCSDTSDDESLPASHIKREHE